MACQQDVFRSRSVPTCCDLLTRERAYDRRNAHLILCRRERCPTATPGPPTVSSVYSGFWPARHIRHAPGAPYQGPPMSGSGQSCSPASSLHCRQQVQLDAKPPHCASPKIKRQTRTTPKGGGHDSVWMHPSQVVTDQAWTSGT